MKFIEKIDLKNKRVFLRADLNVPLGDKGILSDFRLQSILPTIDYIKKNGGKVVLATHIGRPPAGKVKNYFDEKFSTKRLMPWFEERGYEVDYEIDLKQAIEKSDQDFDRILLVENLRFFNGERETSESFAELLARLGDVYVNDAFGVWHREDTSVTLLPEQFDEEKRAFGLLAEKEIKTLSKLRDEHEQPFVVVLGGNKGRLKLNLLERFIDLPGEKRVKTALIGGAIAQNFPNALMDKAKQYGVEILLPVDGVGDGVVYDIGPKTVDIFCKKIAEAKTIFANGTMGVYEQEEFETGTKKILKAIAESAAYSVIGGGDAVAATFKFGLDKQMSFLSTGGGATLAFLAT